MKYKYWLARNNNWGFRAGRFYVLVTQCFFSYFQQLYIASVGVTFHGSHNTFGQHKCNILQPYPCCEMDLLMIVSIHLRFVCLLILTTYQVLMDLAIIIIKKHTHKPTCIMCMLYWIDFEVRSYLLMIINQSSYATFDYVMTCHSHFDWKAKVINRSRVLQKE